MMHRTCLWLVCLSVVSACVVRAARSAESDGFRDVLATAGLGPETLGPLAAKFEYDADDWQVLAQLAYRLDQFRPTKVHERAKLESAHPGELIEVYATVKHVELMPIPTGVREESTLPRLFRCQFESADGAQGSVLVPQVPIRWQGRDVSAEPVKFWGIVLGESSDDRQLLVTDHLAWFPKTDVPPGWLLLVSQGMDVALLDEVRHRQPFVRPEISREGEAFYQCLTSISNVDPQDLATLTRQNVAAVAQEFEAAKPALERRVDELRRQVSNEQEPMKREMLQQQLARTRRELALAAAVERQAEMGLSSVAPMFLEPEDQVGELVRIEGLARRAVRIAVADSTSVPPGLDEYFELEVFTPDSQNLPVVCCVAKLPADFPQGDAIRESVRVDGVFFKCWRYRSRKNLADGGQTGRPQQLYTPVVVGGRPQRVPTPTGADGRWGLWGGIAFLAALATVWIVMLRVADRDRRRLAADVPTKLQKLPERQSDNG